MPAEFAAASTCFLVGSLHAATFITPSDWCAFAAEAERVIQIEPQAPGTMLLYCASALFGPDDPRGLALRELVYEQNSFPNA
jgi:hypothetical protein